MRSAARSIVRRCCRRRAFALRIALGEMADALLASQRALPNVAIAHGYHFRYPEIEIALRGIYR